MEMMLAYIIGLSLIIIVTFCICLFMFIRNMRFSGGSPDSMQHDFTNMMLLFQTMRDTLEQQKDLARRFNKSIKQKVNEIRELTASTQGLDGRVQAVEKELQKILDDAREEMGSLRRRVDYLKDQLPDAGNEEAVESPADSQASGPQDAKSAGGTSTERNIAPSETTPEQDDVQPENGTPLRAIATAQENIHDDPMDQWTGMDFGGTEFDEAEEPLEELEPLEPENPEAARDAFRSLLNMDAPESIEDIETASTARETSNGDRLTPVQQRIYEYSDAGMRAPEIAKELGVGKGEVRLILSLRKDRQT